MPLSLWAVPFYIQPAAEISKMHLRLSDLLFETVEFIQLQHISNPLSSRSYPELAEVTRAPSRS